MLAGQRWLHPRGDPCRAIRASSRASAPGWPPARRPTGLPSRVVALGEVDGFPHPDIPEACPPGDGALVRVNADAAGGPMLRRPVSYLVDQFAVLCLLSAAQSTANRGK